MKIAKFKITLMGIERFHINSHGLSATKKPENPPFPRSNALRGNEKLRMVVIFQIEPSDILLSETFC